MKWLLTFFNICIVLTVSAQYCPERSCDCIVSVAASQVGNCEEGGNNRGYHIEKYLRAANLPSGYAWCAAFVAWTFDVCGIDHSVNAWSPSAVSRNVIYKRGNRNNQTPIRGDVGSLYYSSLGRVGHVFFVENWGDKYVRTVEGNTNDGGSRDGDCVMKRYRPTRTIYKVSRW